MNIEKQIVSLEHIIINAKQLHKQYPNDDAIQFIINQSQLMIKKLNKQQATEIQSLTFNQRSICVNRFRDGGSADFILMPQKVKIASFDMYSARPNKITTCLLSGRCEKVESTHKGWLIAIKFIKESVGIILDDQGEFAGHIPNFKQKYVVNAK